MSREGRRTRQGSARGLTAVAIMELDRNKMRNIVIGVDGSDNAEKAFHWYVNHLHQENRYVYLVQCIEKPTHSTAMSAEDAWVDLKEREREKVSKFGKYQKALDDNKIMGEYVCPYGRNAGEALVKAAKEVDAEMIVMGTRGLGAISRTFLGSVSDHVVHNASCPVVVCRGKR